MPLTRVSFITYNIWNTKRWEQRKGALGQFVDRFRPDIICFQELREETQTFLDQSMPDFRRVDDDFPGWACESNIYWKREMFELLDYGAANVGILEEFRRLFWVRLRLTGTDQTLFVSTAHFTYRGHPIEANTGRSPRVEQTRRVIDQLDTLPAEGEPVFFMGDLNDSSQPVIDLHEAGYLNCFAALGLQPPPTSPAFPTVNKPIGHPIINHTIDWIVSNSLARPIAAMVPHFYVDDVAPSDHWPVLAVYEI